MREVKVKLSPESLQIMVVKYLKMFLNNKPNIARDQLLSIDSIRMLLILSGCKESNITQLECLFHDIVQKIEEKIAIEKFENHQIELVRHKYNELSRMLAELDIIKEEKSIYIAMREITLNPIYIKEFCAEISLKTDVIIKHKILSKIFEYSDHFDKEDIVFELKCFNALLNQNNDKWMSNIADQVINKSKEFIISQGVGK